MIPQITIIQYVLIKTAGILKLTLRATLLLPAHQIQPQPVNDQTIPAVEQNTNVLSLSNPVEQVQKFVLQQPSLSPGEPAMIKKLSSNKALQKTNTRIHYRVSFGQ